MNFADIAQQVERILGKDEVPGSNPGISSKEAAIPLGWLSFCIWGRYSNRGPVERAAASGSSGAACSQGEQRRPGSNPGISSKQKCQFERTGTFVWRRRFAPQRSASLKCPGGDTQSPPGPAPCGTRQACGSLPMRMQQSQQSSHWDGCFFRFCSCSNRGIKTNRRRRDPLRRLFSKH